ncbi:MAG: hypothetical protein QW177_01180 [Candidatus Nitrosotenuis sp.]
MKKLNLKKPYFSIPAIAAIIFGAGIALFGAHYIKEGYSRTEIVEIGGEPFRLHQFTNFHLIAPIGEPNFVDAIRISFDTTTIFQGDEIGVTAVAYGVKPEVKEILVLITDRSFNLETISDKVLYNNVIHMLEDRTAIQLLPSTDPPFSKRQLVPFLIPDQKVTLQAVLVTDSGNGKLRNNDVVTTVYPRTDKLQSEMYKIINAQYTETRIANIEQDRTNTIFLGFSWVGVALILILAGIDVLMRIYAKD